MAGLAPYLQLLNLLGLQLAYGSGTWTWPGGQTQSNAAIVSHGLGRIPVIVIAESNTDQGGQILKGMSFTFTTTQFSTRGVFTAFLPANGGTVPFNWIAIG